MVIETSRLIVKPIDEMSLKNILKYINDIYLNVPIPKNASMYHIKKFLALNNKIKSFNSLGYFSITLKKNLKPIGLISVIPRYINENLINELGYLISKEYQNNGFASEVIFNVLDFILSKTNMDKIYSLVEEDNLVSKYVLENKMKFDFVNVILDTNTFKNIYTLDKFKFKNKVKPLNMVNQL